MKKCICVSVITQCLLFKRCFLFCKSWTNPSFINVSKHLFSHQNYIYEPKKLFNVIEYIQICMKFKNTIRPTFVPLCSQMLKWSIRNRFSDVPFTSECGLHVKSLSNVLYRNIGRFLLCWIYSHYNWDNMCFSGYKTERPCTKHVCTYIDEYLYINFILYAGERENTERPYTDNGYH